MSALSHGEQVHVELHSPTLGAAASTQARLQTISRIVQDVFPLYVIHSSYPAKLHYKE